MAKSTVQKIQTVLGVESDGVWGPKSQTALNDAIGSTGSKPNPILVKIQKLLGVTADGIWGPESQGALNDEFGSEGGGNGPFDAEASSFADPADLVAFQKCKATGKTDKECFKVGDNGIGKFGKLTAQQDIPMVAIHPSDATAKWGSMNAAAHRMVRVTVGSRSVDAAVEDQLGVAGRIDLNPAAAKALNLDPPFLTACTWQWL